MRDDLTKDLLPVHGEAIDPVAMARRDQQKTLPKRFYQRAEAVERDGAFHLSLDGRPARTPAGTPLAVPTRAIGEALAGEWDAQATVIDPGSMPLTRIVNSALDGVTRDVTGVRAEIVKYAGSDLLCYRAGEPTSLVEAQAQAWDPVLAWARDDLGAHFVLAEGVMFVDQPERAVAAIHAAVAAVPAPLRLAGLHVMTTLTGSTVLALAVVHGRLAPADAWTAAHVDEDFQIRAWGEDAEAAARRERRWIEMQAAALLAREG